MARGVLHPVFPTAGLAMIMRAVFLSLLALIGIPVESVAEAVLITSGDSIAHLGDIHPKALQENNALRNDGVGFKYSYWGILGLDFWRSDGQYCTYRDDLFVAITPKQAGELLGVPADEVSTPFFYRFPPGLFGFGCLVLIGIVVIFVRRLIRARALKIVVDEPHLHKALEIYRTAARNLEEEKKAAAKRITHRVQPRIDPWDVAIAYLLATGMEKATAEDQFGDFLAHATAWSTETA